MNKKTKLMTFRGLFYIVLFLFFMSPVLSVTTDTSGQPLAVIIISPLILGLFFILSAFVLDPNEHNVLRIFLILLSMVTFFMSSWLGALTIIKYYDFDPMQEAIVTGVWVFGTMIVVIVIYFLIYAFYKGVHAAAQRKKEMMLQ